MKSWVIVRVFLDRDSLRGVVHILEINVVVDVRIYWAVFHDKSELTNLESKFSRNLSAKVT